MMFVVVFGRCHPITLLEAFAEITGIVHANHVRNLVTTQVVFAGQEKELSVLQDVVD